MTVREAEIWRFVEELAPLALAQSWDNVGLLVQGPPDRSVDSLLLTVDLTEPVFEEAVERGAQAILAYHPPIFAGLKRLLRSDPLQRVLLDSIARGVSIYSPHTALDATTGGITDWLADSLGPAKTQRAIEPVDDDRPMVGAGRLLTLADPVRLSAVVAALKKRLALEHVRVGQPGKGDPSIRTVAVCPGAGGSLFQPLSGVDLYLTGEMRHHDVLDKVRTGAAVVLTEHSNCERGYLPILAQRLSEQFEGLSVRCAQRDRDPLQVR